MTLNEKYEAAWAKLTRRQQLALMARLPEQEITESVIREIGKAGRR